MKLLYTTFAVLLLLPLIGFGALQKYYPSDPDLVHINQPNLFAGKWQKVGFSENFTEYIEPTKLERNRDFTIEIMTMRNYFKPQIDDFSDSKQSYYSHVSYETIDCFQQTISVSKIFLLSGHFAKGALIAEPVEPTWTPIHVSAGTVGLSKIQQACALANLNIEPHYFKSNFMNNI